MDTVGRYKVTEKTRQAFATGAPTNAATGKTIAGTDIKLSIG
jgi:hypothetical protein